MITLSGLLMALLVVIVVGLIFYILFWAVGKLALPEPANKIAMGIIIIALAFVLIAVLLQVIGHPVIALR